LEAIADKPYRHIVIDEAQDLSPDQWRLVRAAVSEVPDDIFIAQ
jgi:ATP-dependent exoDNAse (exonuclease V) beta subunit